MTLDISRDQFSDDNLTERVVAQQNTYIVDSDFNEAGQVAMHRAARQLHRLIKSGLARFGAGWAITGGTNQVTVSAGDAALELEPEKSFIHRLASNTNVSGWTTPTGGDRTDYLYVQAELKEVSATDDPNLVNPDVGKATIGHIRLSFEFKKQEGGSVPSAPAGFYNVTIATIERYSGQATIANGDITNHLKDIDVVRAEDIGAGEVGNDELADGILDSKLAVSYLKADGSRELTGDQAVASGITIDGVDVGELVERIYAHHWEGDSSSAPWPADNDSSLGAWVLTVAGPALKYFRAFAYTKRANDKYLKFRFEAQRRQADVGLIRFYVNGLGGSGYVEQDTTALNTWASYELVVDISAIADDSDCRILMTLTHGVSATTWMRKLEITAHSHN